MVAKMQRYSSVLRDYSSLLCACFSLTLSLMVGLTELYWSVQNFDCLHRRRIAVFNTELFKLCLRALFIRDVHARAHCVRHAVDVDQLGRKEHRAHGSVLRSEVQFEITHTAFGLKLFAKCRQWRLRHLRGNRLRARRAATLGNSRRDSHVYA